MSAFSIADAVGAVAASLLSGSVVLGSEGRSVGPWAPEVSDGFGWAISNLRGDPVFLAYDAFEIARAFVVLDVGIEEDLGVYCALPDAYVAALRRYEEWAWRHQFVACGDPTFVPEPPSLAEYRARAGSPW